MKRLLVIAIACLGAPLASAELYKYVDKDGKTVYSDQPPVNTDTKQLNISSGASAPSKSAMERDKELQKGRDEAKERAKKAEAKEMQAANQEQACNAARAANRVYTDGGRVTKFDEKGERVFLDDREIEAERVRTQRLMEEACKK